MELKRCDCDGKDCHVRPELRPTCKAITDGLATVLAQHSATKDRAPLEEMRGILFDLGIMASYVLDDTMDDTFAHFVGAIIHAKQKFDEMVKERKAQLAAAAQAVAGREAEERGESAPAPAVPLPVYDAVRAEAVLRTWNPSTATKH